MSYDVFITILLTAITVCLTILAALLGVLGLGIGILALWGYQGLTAAAERKVSQAMDDKLKEYPSATEAMEYIKRMKTSVEFWEQMQNQMITSPAPKSVETPSNASVQGDVVAGTGTVYETSRPPEAEIATYPGEEAPDVRERTGNKQASDGNAGTDTSKV